MASADPDGIGGADGDDAKQREGDDPAEIASRQKTLGLG
jgi:hypothetical protein